MEFRNNQFNNPGISKQVEREREKESLPKKIQRK